MLPSSATNSIEFVTTTIITFLVITVAFSFVGLLLGRSLGAKSKFKRVAIFNLFTFCGLCLGAFYAMSKLKGGSLAVVFPNPSFKQDALTRAS